MPSVFFGKWNPRLYLRGRTMGRQVKELGQVVEQFLWAVGKAAEEGSVHYQAG